MIWLYNRTGSPYLLDLVRLLHAQGYDWLAQYADFHIHAARDRRILKLEEGDGLTDLPLSTHGVNNGQAVKTAPVWSLVTTIGRGPHGCRRR